MFCPFKFANPQVDMTMDFCDQKFCQCEEKHCQLWNVALGQCGLVAQAYLAGLEVERREAGIKTS